MAFTGAAIFGAAASVGGAVTSIAGAASAIAPILTVASGGLGIASAISGAGQRAQMPTIQQAPRVPDYTAIRAAESQSVLRAASSRTKTVLTNPLGETSGDTSIIKKKLVGRLGE